LKIEKKDEKKPAADAKKDDSKKDSKKPDTKKPDTKKPETKKPEAAKPAPAEPVKEENWENLLPALKFDFYDYKTLFVNAPSKKEALEKLCAPDMWDDNALAFWLIQYQKYDKSEGEKTHICNNMLNGFIQRIDEKLRRHSLGAFGVYGSEPELEQFGLMLWRGKDIPAPMLEHPQFEFWSKRKLDVAKDQELILQYLTVKEGQVEGREVQSW
jgi:hypothetical protein